MRDWLLFMIGVVSVSVLVVIGAAGDVLPTDHHWQVIAGIALISEAAVLCVSAQNHVWRMLRATILFFYWPFFFLMTLDAHPHSWLEASNADPSIAITLITFASMVGIVIGLLWYVVTLAQSTAPRTVMVHGQRYLIREGASGPYLDPTQYP